MPCLGRDLLFRLDSDGQPDAAAFGNDAEFARPAYRDAADDEFLDVAQGDRDAISRYSTVPGELCP